MLRLRPSRLVRRPPVLALLLSLGALGASGCMDKESVEQMQQTLGVQRPDELPVMVNKEPPFRYPASLYSQRVQGNVTLRLFIDRDGKVIGDSTRVEESSGYPSLDSAAVKGSHELGFVPAKRRGEAVPVSILFPVYFRHPEAAALPGDTILQPRPGARP